MSTFAEKLRVPPPAKALMPTMGRRAHAQERAEKSASGTNNPAVLDFSRIPAHTKAAQGMQTNSFANSALRTPTIVEPKGKAGAEKYEAEPSMAHEKADPPPAPLNADGLIDGEWTSGVKPRVFTSGGKTGSALVNWVGGNGGAGEQGVGSITTVAPVIEASDPPAAGGTAHAWVRPGTGTATVTRSYKGVLIGANGPNYYITARVATDIDRHEELHVASSKTHHDTNIAPLERRIARHTGQAKALTQDAGKAAAKTTLETVLNWNASITRFQNSDTASNSPNGPVDAADGADPHSIKNYGARTVGGVNYPNYIDIPPGPGP